MATAIDKMIKLESSDEHVFELPKKIVEKSVTIKHMITDLGEDNDEPIPLLEITSDVLGKVVEWLAVVREEKVSTSEENKDEEYLTEETYDGQFSEFETHYFDPTIVTQETLFAIIVASNFLDIKSLLDRACKQVANKIKGKTPQEIRDTFNIKNDFTPEEEEEIRKENEWAESL